MPKHRYSVNTANQLVLHRTVKRKNQAVVIPGQFWVDDNNRLSYIIEDGAFLKSPYLLPRKITFRGKWSLREDTTIRYILYDSRFCYGSQAFTLRGDIEAVRKNAVVYRLASSTPDYAMRTIILQGRWQSDQHNRLSFLVEMKKERPDALTFQGRWEVDRNQVTYRYVRTRLVKSRKEEHVLTFKGYWEIHEKSRLTYILDRGSGSLFDFKVRLECPEMMGTEGSIKYRVGIGVKQREYEQIITLEGTWRIVSSTSVNFTMDYGDGRTKAMEFELSHRFLERNCIMLGLKTYQGRDLGIRLMYSRSFLKNKAQWFLRCIDEYRQKRFEGGISIPW